MKKFFIYKDNYYCENHLVSFTGKVESTDSNPSRQTWGKGGSVTLKQTHKAHLCFTGGFKLTITGVNTTETSVNYDAYERIVSEHMELSNIIREKIELFLRHIKTYIVVERTNTDEFNLDEFIYNMDNEIRDLFPFLSERSTEYSNSRRISIINTV